MVPTSSHNSKAKELQADCQTVRRLPGKITHVRLSVMVAHRQVASHFTPKKHKSRKGNIYLQLQAIQLHGDLEHPDPLGWPADGGCIQHQGKALNQRLLSCSIILAADQR